MKSNLEYLSCSSLSGTFTPLHNWLTGIGKISYFLCAQRGGKRWYVMEASPICTWFTLHRKGHRIIRQCDCHVRVMLITRVIGEISLDSFKMTMIHLISECSSWSIAWRYPQESLEPVRVRVMQSSVHVTFVWQFLCWLRSSKNNGRSQIFDNQGSNYYLKRKYE